jgi:hypothetical protein
VEAYGQSAKRPRVQTRTARNARGCIFARSHHAIAPFDARPEREVPLRHAHASACSVALGPRWARRAARLAARRRARATARDHADRGNETE